MLDQGGHADHIQKAEASVAVRQRTLAATVSCSGVGLHSGSEITLDLLPAPADSGIVFIRTDADDACIAARWDNVVDTRLCSVLANQDGVAIGTVEHVMAALAGCGIDNAEIRVSGAEVPIMDGSSEPFVKLIREAGVVEQAASRRIIRVLKSVEVDLGNAKARLDPAEKQEFDLEIDFANKVIDRQSTSLSVVNGAFCKELAGARTFALLSEVEAMRAAGLAKGGSLDNAIVVGDDGILNDGGLRYDDEFVRHKMLDAVGDLYLAGATVVGRFSGVCSGHAANNKLLRALFADDTAWAWDTVSGDDAAFAVDGGIHPVALAAE